MDPITASVLISTGLSVLKSEQDRADNYRKMQLAAQLGTLTPYTNAYDSLRNKLLNEGSEIPNQLGTVIGGIQSGMNIGQAIDLYNTKKDYYQSLADMIRNQNSELDSVSNEEIIKKIDQALKNVDSEKLKMPEFTSNRFPRKERRFTLGGGV
jgi:hypothetical protein